MEFVPYENVASWEEYFTTKSINVKKYETKYNIEVDDGSEETFTLKLRVSTLNYGNCCAWELITNQISFPESHPFERIEKDQIHLYKDDTEIYVAGINAKNKVMDSLFEMIMMSNEELSENSGNIDANYYRSRLVKILHDLWD